MDQNWFEMPKIRQRKLANAVWIPLRAIHQVEEVGRYGYTGYKSEFYGVGTIAVPTDSKLEAEELGWDDIGIKDTHSGYVEDGEYIPADVYKSYRNKLLGLQLILEQRGNSAEHSEWHLHQDFVITLGLKREGDIWVRPNEGYIEVAKLHRREDGSPYLIEVRASHLRDYLCARVIALYVTSYRSRKEIVEDASHISWEENFIEEVNDKDRWKGRVVEIHEGGMIYGGKTAIFHMARTDVDSEEDVPTMEGLPTDDKVNSKTWTKGDSGRKLYLVEGELWRNEWIEPASKSPIVRGDKTIPTVFFIIDAEGTKENSEKLIEGGRWLWFRPEVIAALVHRRGGTLGWHTRDTGRVGCLPDYTRHFGINSLGFINVYAKDIALLPEWQQKIWSGYNVSPEGKVSAELLASQINAEPARTQAPERFLAAGLETLNHVAHEKLGITLIRQHEQIPELLVRVHRFRSTDKEGLFSLAKDLARLTADSIDARELQKIVSPPKGTTWGSLKSLENLLATIVDPRKARAVLSPLVGIYELRHADAHLAIHESDEALNLVGVDRNAPYVIQGYQLLHACVSSIYAICQIIKNWNIEGNPDMT